jgi:hypothetical protein
LVWWTPCIRRRLVGAKHERQGGGYPADFHLSSRRNLHGHFGIIDWHYRIGVDPGEVTQVSISERYEVARTVIAHTQTSLVATILLKKEQATNQHLIE